MAALAAVLYGALSYALFLGTFIYAVGFVANLPLPKTIDSGVPGAWPNSVTIDAALLALFAVQHSVMARPWFKRLWTRVVAPSIERSTYVLFASSALVLLFWQWQPMPNLVWQVTTSGAALALRVVSAGGWMLVLLSSFAISHFELFGLRQVLGKLPMPEFRTPVLYRIIRHPIYLGFIMAFWATPTMTVGHLVFAVGTAGYILIGIQLEEHDLIAQFGDRYRRYRDRVPMLLPWSTRRAEKVRVHTAAEGRH